MRSYYSKYKINEIWLVYVFHVIVDLIVKGFFLYFAFEACCKIITFELMLRLHGHRNCLVIVVTVARD
jgi:hypothetical protein